MDEAIKDIANLMLDARVSVSQTALDLLLGASVDAASLVGYAPILLPALTRRLTPATDASLLLLACKISINLGAEDDFLNACSTEVVHAFVDAVADIAITHGDSDVGEYAAMVLSNATRHAEIAEYVAKGRATQLLEAFCHVNSKVDHLALVFANLTQAESGRQTLAPMDRLVFQRLLTFLAHPSQTRRTGVALAIRNVCFDTTRHVWLLSDTVSLLPHILLPLAGPEEFDDDDMNGMPDELHYLPEDKTREPDLATRKALVQAIFQLCATRHGRDTLKAKKVYPVLREYHKWEPAGEDMDQDVYSIVNLLQGDESGVDNIKLMDLPELPLRKIADAEK